MNEIILITEEVVKLNSITTVVCIGFISIMIGLLISSLVSLYDIYEKERKNK